MTDRLRVSLFCPSCVPGYHLPFFSGVVRGVFADQGLLVDILDPPPPPGSTNSFRVAEGGADFGLTGVTYFLLALKQAGGDLPARFVATLHQRSPLGAIVAAGSDIHTPADVVGRRMGRGELTGWLADEAQQALADRGLGRAVVVPLGHGEAPYALGRGDIDVMATFVDAMPGAGTKGGHAVRAVPLGGDRYTSGLIANDRVPHDVVVRMRHAVADAFEAQRRDPEAGVADLCARFPDVRPEDARAGWDLLVPYVFGDRPVGTMSRARWSATLEWADRAHGFGSIDAARVHRPELVDDEAAPAHVVAAGVPAAT